MCVCVAQIENLEKAHAAEIQKQENELKRKKDESDAKARARAKQTQKENQIKYQAQNSEHQATKDELVMLFVPSRCLHHS